MSHLDGLHRSISMALLVVLLLFPVLATDPLGLNSPPGFTTPVYAQDGKDWSGKWRSTWHADSYMAAMNLDLTQNGNQVNGDLELQYGGSLVRGNVTGTVSGNKYTAKGTFIYMDFRVDNYEFTLAPDGQSMTVAPLLHTSINGEERSFLEKGVVYTLVRTGTGKGAGTGTGTIAVAWAEGKGDYNRDGKVTELDALAALKMSVKQLTEDLKLDMDGNGKVTAEDARLILKKALGK
jgi:hypothetical protein